MKDETVKVLDKDLESLSPLPSECSSLLLATLKDGSESVDKNTQDTSPITLQQRNSQSVIIAGEPTVDKAKETEHHYETKPNQEPKRKELVLQLPQPDSEDTNI